MGMVVFAYASYHNYPGGVALWKLHEQESSVVYRTYSRSNPALVHIDVAAAQQVCDVIGFVATNSDNLMLHFKGISRFWQLDRKSDQYWSYSKQENITEYSSFDYCVGEAPTLPGFSVIATANGFHPAMLYSALVRADHLLKDFHF
jgi:hypothetical protein